MSGFSYTNGYGTCPQCDEKKMLNGFCEQCGNKALEKQSNRKELRVYERFISILAKLDLTDEQWDNSIVHIVALYNDYTKTITQAQDMIDKLEEILAATKKAPAPKPRTTKKPKRRKDRMSSNLIEAVDLLFNLNPGQAVEWSVLREVMAKTLRSPGGSLDKLLARMEREYNMKYTKRKGTKNINRIRRIL